MEADVAAYPADDPFRVEAAPWAPALKVVSVLAAGVLCYASYAVYRRIPTGAGFAHGFGLGVAVLPLLVLVASAFFIVRGYTVDSVELSVERLLTSTRVPLAGLSRAWFDPDVCTNSMRIFGNGGLFAYCGWFYSKRLGFYRAFATNLRNAVVLEFADRKVVVSPISPRILIEHLRRIHPDLRVDSDGGGA